MTDLPPAALACLRALATARRAWCPAADLEAAGFSVDLLVALGGDSPKALVAYWPEKDAWALTPLALFRLGLEVEDPRTKKPVWVPLEVRERWELVEVPGAPGVKVTTERRHGRAFRKEVVVPAKVTRAYDRVPFYSQPGSPPCPDNPPGRRGQQEGLLAIPSWLPCPHAGPEQAAIEREEQEFVMRTRYAEDGSEITGPLEILGVKVRPLRRRAKGA